GAFGNGSRMKFVANLLVAVHNAAAAEAIVLGTKAGLDPERILEVIGSGAGNSRIFELRGPMMAKGVYTPPTATMHVLQKDSAIIAEFARALGVETPMLDAAPPHRSGVFPRQPQRQGRRDPEGAVGLGAVRYRQAQHEIGGIRRAGRMAPGLGLLPAHQ